MRRRARALDPQTPARRGGRPQGSPEADELSTLEWKRLLESWEDPGIDSAVDEELQEYMARRRGEEDAA